MHGTVVAAQPPVEVRHRTITLTNRAPIRIIEDLWPISAQGKVGWDVGAPWSWEVSFYVRHEKPPEGTSFFSNTCQHRTIVYGSYRYIDENDEDNSQIVRVGHVLSDRESACDMWKHMLAVGEEMRSRVRDQKMHTHITQALDICFADLSPQPA